MVVRLAFEQILQEAEAGDAEAQYTVGEKYLYGIGLEQNTEEALKWLKLSAKQWHIEAAETLGSIYYWGNGVKKNNEEALLWYRKAAKKGYKEVLPIIREIETVMRSIPASVKEYDYSSHTFRRGLDELGK